MQQLRVIESREKELRVDRDNHMAKMAEYEEIIGNLKIHIDQARIEVANSN
jgi:hypothetical protein